MKNKTRCLYVFDKEYGQSHSFVDGMIINNLLKEEPESIAIYSKPKTSGFSSIEKQIHVSPFNRKGWGRILHPFYIINVLLKNKYSNIFIRNEPLVLLLSVIIKIVSPLKLNIVYQSSYPHEIYSGTRFSRFLNRLIYKACITYVDRVLVVSSLARERMKSYSRRLVDICIIPLCTDFPIVKRKDIDNRSFVYIGTYHYSRKLDVLIESVYLLFEKEVKVSLTLIGGDKKEFISFYPSIKDKVEVLEKNNCLKFINSVDRALIPDYLSKFGFGINIIPPTAQFLESSSTKLGEYLSQGLPVISSDKITFHEDCYKSKIGSLVEFNKLCISEKLLEYHSLTNEEYKLMSDNAVEFVSRELKYDKYITMIHN
ncbi:glycosyltransferase [Vibrio alginolyticus]|uniref:glycosyltransferase n=1 Tax=Vibrio alginolyticus TaxID=663 RepID=UPI003752699B